MNRKKSKLSAAVIDIRSDMIRMRISQASRGKIVDLENLEHPINIGHEVFSHGKIGFDIINEISSIIKSFMNVLNEYKITKYKIIATTAIREAKNYEFVIDQIKIQNGVNVEIMDSNQEKSLIYNQTEKKLKNKNMKKFLENTVMVHIGTGSIGIAVYKKEEVVFSCSIPIGYVRLYDIFHDIMEEETDINILFEEYLNESMQSLSRIFKDFKTDSIIVLGKEVELITSVLNSKFNNEMYFIGSDDVFNLYEKLEGMTVEKIESKFNLPQEKAKLIYSIVSIYVSILKLTGTEKIISPKVELWDCVISQILYHKQVNEYESHIKKNSVSCAKWIAYYYNCDIDHCELVKKFSGILFNRLKKIHGLGARYKTLLEIACYLHEFIYPLNLGDSLRHMFNVVKNINIYGLNNIDNSIVSHISSCNMLDSPEFKIKINSSLSPMDELTVIKLIAILRVSDSLDKSQKKKIKDLKVRIKGNEISIIIQSDMNMLLEKWAFNCSKGFFEDVFGFNLNLIIKPKKMSI